MKKEEINKNNFYKITKEGVEIRIHAFPNSRKNIIEKNLFEDVRGDIYIKIRVTTAPEDGKANKTIIKLLSKELGISKSKINIIKGEKSSSKVALFDILNDDDLLFNIANYFK